jgi:hypothetical protein
MSMFDATALFWSFAALCGLFAIYLAVQTRDSSQIVAIEDHVPFSAAAPEAAPTGFGLDPRGPEDAVGDLQPAAATALDDYIEEAPAEETPSETEAGVSAVPDHRE